MLTIEPRPGEHMEAFLRRCLDESQQRGEPIATSFNGIEFVVWPTMDPRAIPDICGHIKPELHIAGIA